MNNKTYFTWMFAAAAVLVLVHYIILWTLKNDESIFFLLGFILAALAVTTWIFDFLKRRK